jgi:hypothetical protein
MAMQVMSCYDLYLFMPIINISNCISHFKYECYAFLMLYCRLYLYRDMLLSTVLFTLLAAYF